MFFLMTFPLEGLMDTYFRLKSDVFLDGFSPGREDGPATISFYIESDVFPDEFSPGKED